MNGDMRSYLHFKACYPTLQKHSSESWTWWHIPPDPASGRLSQEGRASNFSLGCTAVLHSKTISEEMTT